MMLGTRMHTQDHQKYVYTIGVCMLRKLAESFARVSAGKHNALSYQHTNTIKLPTHQTYNCDARPTARMQTRIRPAYTASSSSSLLVVNVLASSSDDDDDGGDVLSSHTRWHRRQISHGINKVHKKFNSLLLLQYTQKLRHHR